MFAENRLSEAEKKAFYKTANACAKTMREAFRVAGNGIASYFRKAAVEVETKDDLARVQGEMATILQAWQGLTELW